MASPIRLLCFFDYVCHSGFAQVSSNIMRELKRTGGFEADVVAINYTGNPYDLDKFPFNVYTAFNQGDNHDVYGREVFLRMLTQREYDVVFIIQDTFIVQTIVDRMQEIIAAKKHKPTTVFYYPIDATPMKEWITEAVYKFDYAVPYTDYACRETLKVGQPPKGVSLESPIHHGVNLSDFHYMEDRKLVSEFRKTWFMTRDLSGKVYNSAEDRFVIMNLNRNQPRKNILGSFQLLKALRDMGDDSLLYLHMAYRDVGGDIVAYGEQMGFTLAKDYIAPSPKRLAEGVETETIGVLYNAVDAVVSTTLGEGFGLSMIEAFASRTPMIAPDSTSFTEIGADNRARLIRAGHQTDSFTVQGPMDFDRIRPLVDIEEMARQIISIRKGNLPDVDGAEQWAKEHSWENICQKWVALLTKAGQQAIARSEERLKAPEPNRAARRKMKRKK